MPKFFKEKDFSLKFNNSILLVPLVITLFVAISFVMILVFLTSGKIDFKMSFISLIAYFLCETEKRLSSAPIDCSSDKYSISLSIKFHSNTIS